MADSALPPSCRGIGLDAFRRRPVPACPRGVLGCRHSWTVQAKAAMIHDLRATKESCACELTELRVAKQARPLPSGVQPGRIPCARVESRAAALTPCLLFTASDRAWAPIVSFAVCHGSAAAALRARLGSSRRSHRVGAPPTRCVCRSSRARWRPRARRWPGWLPRRRSSKPRPTSMPQS